jgi:DNA-binding HxlR family transcriptional regulator
MTGYGQFCAVARAHEALGGRWTLLVVRELLMGSSRFNDIRRGIPRISRTMLSERLQALVAAGAVAQAGPDYYLTAAGEELAGLIGALGTWGQRWLPRDAAAEDLDLAPLLVAMRRRVDAGALPKQPLVVRFEIKSHPAQMLLLKPALGGGAEASLCTHNPGFPELVVRGPLAALAAWWRGDRSFFEAQYAGLSVEGPKALARAFPRWFQRYLFAEVSPAL